MKLNLIVTFLFLSLFSYGQTTSTISGKIKDIQNKPIPGATVQITYIPWNKIYNVTTDKKGVFYVSNLSPGGPYTIYVTYDGYKSTTKEISSIDLGNDNKFNLYLYPTTISKL
jgi:hypothetical protein